MSFNDILEAVAKMSLDDQESLLKVLRQRQHERRRAQIAKDIKAARREHKAGKGKTRTPLKVMDDVLS
jgi:DNA-binding NtrC family response regulator